MRFKFYILISFLIHAIILIFTPVNIKKERLKGEKITPIEIINNNYFNSSKGNTNRNSTKEIPKINQDDRNEIIKKDKKIKETNDLKLKDKNEKVNGDFQIKNKEIFEKFEKKVLKKENKIQNKNKVKKEDKVVIKEKN